MSLGEKFTGLIRRTAGLPATVPSALLVPPPLPMTEEVAQAAAAYFRQPGILCLALGQITNEGFAASLSFNSDSFSCPTGSVELSLRRSVLRVTPPDDDLIWAWGEGLLEVAREKISAFEHTAARQNSISEQESHELAAELVAKIKGSVPFVGAEINGKVSSKDTTQNGRAMSDTEQTKSVSTLHHVEIQRRLDHFQIRFQAHPASDLASLNPDLSRLGLLSINEPSQVKAESVSIDMALPLAPQEGGVEHALKIRSASGAFGALSGHPNRQIVGEILLSKFLTPLHDQQRLWPSDQ